MNATRQTLKQLTEMPMQGDPEPGPDAPYRGIDRDLKARTRDQNIQVVAQYFPDAQPSGQFGVAFTHRGSKYVLRMTSNAVRVFQDGTSLFDVSGAARDLAIMVACTAIKHVR